MSSRRCPFCHEWVSELSYESHLAVHTKKLPDGQMKDHISVPPSERYAGSLQGAPRNYRHPLCGATTVMPEEFIRSYLVNPFLYNSRTFCCGCHDYVDKSNLYWTETGECMADYTKRLQDAYVRDQGLIEKCRDSFGEPPRAFTREERMAFLLRLTPQLGELFVKTNDKLLRLLDEQQALRERGEVVWGCLIQANNKLFDGTNPHTLPANILYSLDPYYDDRVSELADLASELYSMKNTVPNDATLRHFIDAVTDEKKRILRQRLPRHVCGGRSTYFATLLIQPSHLPDGRLVRKFFPLVVNYDETEGVMILPSSYWPRELVSLWRSPLR